METLSTRLSNEHESSPCQEPECTNSENSDNDEDDLFSLPVHTSSGDPLDIKPDLEQFEQEDGELVVSDVPESSDRAGASGLRCTQCGLSCREQEDVLTTVNEHSHFTAGQRKREFFMSSCLCCKICGMTFRRKLSLAKHARTHVLGQPFTCFLCAESFSQKSQLALHMETAHSVARPYQCDVCGEGFISPSGKYVHMRTHDGEALMKCGECGATFTEVRALTQHRKEHEAERFYSCRECGRPFQEKKTMVRHMKIHLRQKPYGCAHCDQSFYTKKARASHAEVHVKHVNPRRRWPLPQSAEMLDETATEGQRTFRCRFCAKVFFSRYARNRHALAHGPSRPYKCGECGKGFTQKCNLKTHLYVHTGERRFVCDICGATFTQSGTLNRHKKAHHQMSQVSRPEDGASQCEESMLQSSTDICQETI